MTGGGARTWANVNDYKFSGIYLPGIGQIGSTAAPAEYTFSSTGVAAAPTQRNTHDTYLAGILGKPLPNVSIYYSFSTNAGITLHVRSLAGDNAHHIIEAAFKAVARALKDAVALDPRVTGVPSTKGSL